MSAYLDKTRRTYRQALADRCADAVKRGAQDHKAERELARVNARQANKYQNPNNKVVIC